MHDDKRPDIDFPMSERVVCGLLACFIVWIGGKSWVTRPGWGNSSKSLSEEVLPFYCKF